MRTFLGLVGYYRKFIHNFSKIAAPLQDVLKNDSEFIMTEQRLHAFDALRKALISSPILIHPDFHQEFLLYTDASNFAIGFILGQIRDKKECVIAYGGFNEK